jgi:hypothetical protein
MGTGQGFACQEVAGWVIGWVCNKIDRLLLSEPGLLVNHPDLLPTLLAVELIGSTDITMPRTMM